MGRKQTLGPCGLAPSARLDVTFYDSEAVARVFAWNGLDFFIPPRSIPRHWAVAFAQAERGQCIRASNRKISGSLPQGSSPFVFVFFALLSKRGNRHATGGTIGGQP